MKSNAAEAVALQGLAFIAADDDRFGALMGASGLSVDELRARASDPEFLGFVLDFLLQDDDAVVAFAAEVGLPPEQVMTARAALPGGDNPHWT